MRFGVALVLLGSLFAMLALESGLPWSPLCWWSAGSFFAVAAAYFGLGPRLLGKRSDGTLSPFPLLAFLPYYLFTWGSWYLRLWLSREPAWNEVAPSLFVGRRARLGELPDGARVVVDLTAELQEERGVRAAAEYICLPTLDGTAPGEDAARVVSELVPRQDAAIYVHCAYGHGRSAAVAAAIMIGRGVVGDLDEAIAQLKTSRRAIALNSLQRDWVRSVSRSTSDRQASAR